MDEFIKPKSPILTIVVIIITAILFGGGAYAYQSNKAKKDQEELKNQITDLKTEKTNLKKQVADLQRTTTTLEETDSTSTSTTSVTTDPTASWKTFTNNLFGWTIKYPNDYYIDTEDSEKDFSKRGGADVGIDYIGGDTYWANYDLNANTTEGGHRSGAQAMALMVYKETDSMTIQQFVESKYQDISGSANVKAGTVDGIQYTMTGNDGGKSSNNTNIITVFKKGTYFYVINYGNLGGLDTTFLANYKMMLSTFQFTK